MALNNDQLRQQHIGQYERLKMRRENIVQQTIVWMQEAVAFHGGLTNPEDKAEVIELRDGPNGLVAQLRAALGV
jgi:hypothetical protein